MTTTSDALQPTFDGLAPRKRRRRAPAERIRADARPIAQVVLDVQATHLGRTFDYLVDEHQSESAQPGVMVRVRFGGRLIDGIIWNRVETSDTPASSLRFIERVITPHVLVSASMREDITRIADAYGGTRANILRLAVPPRVARVDKEQQLAATSRWIGRSRFSERDDETLERGFQQFSECYDGAARLRAAIEGSGFAAFVCDARPGARAWSADIAWMIVDAMRSGMPAIVVLPGLRQCEDLARALETLGLQRFAHTGAEHGGFAGDFAIMGAALAPAERYRAYVAAATGQIRCVIGTRAAMYAPVEGRALFVIVDDAAYQNADGMMPYAQARGVMRLRAAGRGGVFVAMAFARSPLSQWEVGRDARTTPVSGPSEPVTPLPSVRRDSMPWIRWLNREELNRLADPTIGSRVPHTAVRILSQALETGPILLSIPADGVGEALACTRCHRQARCAKCTGPLQLVGDAVPRCRWCAAAAVNWRCPECSCERMRVVRVGATGTAHELSGLFRGVPIVLSSPNQPRGVIEEVDCRPQIVVATPGAEPRVLPSVLDARANPGEYRAVAILDAWTSLYSPGIDARVDALTAWMRAMSLCAPRTRGGQGLLIGESDPALARSLMVWDPTLLAAKELEEREQTGMPPTFAVACVWGRRDAVMNALTAIGAIDGAWAEVSIDGVAMPAMLGPVPIAQPVTVSARELESTADRVKAVVRVPLADRAELAVRLRAAVSHHVASRQSGELRFQVDPKDLM
ncbi:primosome assembly protein PriA [Bifidobacterium goeldii]|uniref:Primosome assembly protein PriA n=1 Tax=Bifidobacterium goeldii TaxID=2306975 RepID=A0A430FJQ1_9BIFI|nr:primosomal protein N' [Bifidobacterium goeldii]RSX53114.1 primosome assembly protein PriA [Bifidobacterium goeldii]